ncbi:MAG: fasciclin domain-containing protein [Pseudomonadota bacterium]
MIRSIFAIITLMISSFAFAGDHSQKKQTIVDIAVGAGSFETLVTALKAADLVGTLQGEGPFTVFAPTDEAFAALPPGALQSLLDNPEQLTKVLTLHVVAGQAKAADVVGLDSVTSLQGAELEIDTSSGVSVAGANVVQADITAVNGVIHVIDRVILPQS